MLIVLMARTAELRWIRDKCVNALYFKRVNGYKKWTKVDTCSFCLKQTKYLKCLDVDKMKGWVGKFESWWALTYSAMAHTLKQGDADWLLTLITRQAILSTHPFDRTSFCILCLLSIFLLIFSSDQLFPAFEWTLYIFNYFSTSIDHHHISLLFWRDFTQQLISQYFCIIFPKTNKIKIPPE